MVTQIWESNGSGKDLLPYGIKPLPELMLIYRQWSPVEISREMLKISISHYIIFKTKLLEIPPYLQGDIELIHTWICASRWT